MNPVLRLYEDIYSSDASEVGLPALPRMIFGVHGVVTIGGTSMVDGEAWHGEGAVTLNAAKPGVTCWRFELAASGASDGAAVGRGVSSRAKLLAELETVPAGDQAGEGGRLIDDAAHSPISRPLPAFTCYHAYRLLYRPLRAGGIHASSAPVVRGPLQ